MDWRIRRTLAVMHQQIACPLGLAMLAQQVNLSTSRFAHLFRAEMGQSPAHYLRDLRLDSALLLLYDSTLSIKEVMAAVGFNDPSHFTRAFVDRHGVSPTEFRTRTVACDQQTVVATWLSSRNRQHTAFSAKGSPAPLVQRSSIFEIWRDERAEGA